MSAEPTRAMVLWCPDWPIRALVRAERVAEGAPVAVIDRGEVFACSAAARRDGVRRGLRLREAQARCASLIVQPYDPVIDGRAFEPVLVEIEQAIPGVQPMRPGICTIAARGPSRYYGGERAAAAALLGVAAQCGIPDARVGLADGPFAAEQAARRAGVSGGTRGQGGTRGHGGTRGGIHDPLGAVDGIHDSGGDAKGLLVVEPGGSAAFLKPIGVEVFGDAAFVTLLKRLGLATLGDLADLDAAALLDRFGALGARAHALASGWDGTAVIPRAPQQILERSVEFEPGLDRVDQVTFGFRAAADDFVAGLTKARLVCTSITVTVESSSGALSERVWLHPRWFTAFDVIDRVRWQLQGADAIERGLDSPVVRVTVSPQSVDAVGNHEDGLWGGGPDERIHHAFSRVQSMLGHDAVMTGAVGGGRLLAERQLLVPWGDPVPAAGSVAGSVAGSAAGKTVASSPWPGSLPPPLPATVFDPPRPAEVFDSTGEPVDVDGRGVLSGEPAMFRVPGALMPGALMPGAGMPGAGAQITGGTGAGRTITAWAGPWPIDERWWDATQARCVLRCHVVDDDGMAWLLMLDRHHWWAEARYD
jgi:Nucleotidyltransferase/DNA polymerase involved in DNA repair